MGAPALLWFAIFLAGPLVSVVLLSFKRRGVYGGVEDVFQLDNFFRTFRPVYLSILGQSVSLSLLTGALCLLVAVPMAWGLTGLAPRWKRMVLVLLAVPFFMNLIARIYALKTFLHVEGPVARLLALVGWEGEALHLAQNFPLVLYGLVVTYLPFLLLPVWVQLEKTDPSQMEAALDLGETRSGAFLKIVLPQLRPAIASGLLLVVVPVLGEFVIPDLLGGAKTMLAGNLISEQFLKARDWPFGAALAVELVVLLGLMAALILRWGARGTGRAG